MSRDEYKEVVGEVFWHVYYRYYRENGIIDRHAYDPDLLSQLGLPFDADSQTIKKRFRDLAKRYHPDAGGEAAQFIEFMEQFKNLDRR
jgi:DnaJ-domain-containing protein 1